MSMKALMWKHMLIRRKKFVKAAFEIVLPTIWMLLLFLVHIQSQRSRAVTYQTEETSPQTYEELLNDTDIKSIHYCCSEDRFVRKLMKRVESKMVIRKGIVGHKTEFETLYNLGKALEDDYGSSFAVLFNDVNEKLHNLNYTLRSQHYYPDEIEPEEFYPGLNSFRGRVYEDFTAVQISIDTSYIELLSKMPLKKKISIQPFPYPEFTTKRTSGQDFYDDVFPLFIINGYFFVVIIVTVRVIPEKLSGIKVLLKMMGVDKYLLWISHYLDCMILQLISHFIILIFFKMENSMNYSMLPETNIFLFECGLFMYTSYVILFSFAISTFFTQSLYALTTVSVIWIASQVLNAEYMDRIKDNVFATYLWSILPNGSIFWIFKIIGYFERNDEGIHFGNIFTRTNVAAISYGEVLLTLFLNCALLAFIVIYVENVNPGPYGIPKSFAYIFQLSYWSNIIPKPNSERIENGVRNEENDNFERPLVNVEVGVKILNVKKVFYKNGYEKNAVNGVTLNIYKGGITVLLGHNGAGKTTLMSIITGMLPATEGEVYVNDFNTKTNMNEIHKSMGLCPQENIAFSDLTVMEHIQFIGMIHGLSMEKSKVESTEILSKLNLLNKSDELCVNLSGGARRRLQLALAVSGNSSVLILDEPTSGLDSKHRREIWQILMNLKRDHTILLTTHYMDEADILGDRIAIMNQGSVKCYGTSLFLKNQICPGYKLMVTKKKNFDTSLLANEIENKFEKYDIITETPEKIQYELQSDDSKNFYEFITNLEKDLSKFGISSFGLSLPTIEEVFLRICIDEKNEATHLAPLYNDTEIPDEDADQCSLWLRAMKALFYKRLLHSRKKIFLWCSLVVTVILCIVFGTIADGRKYHDYDSLDNETSVSLGLNLSMYRRNEAVVLFSSDVPKRHYEKRLSNYFQYDKTIKFQETANVYNAVMAVAVEKPSDYYDRYLVAVSLNETGHTGLYSTSVYHALPVVVNLITNIIASDAFGSKAEPYINVYNRPIESLDSLKPARKEEKAPSAMKWAMYLSLGWGIFMSVFITYPVEEAESGSRELILMTGVNKIIYYGAMYLYDLALCLLFSFSLFIILIDPYDRFTCDTLGSLLVLILVFCPVMLTSIYALGIFFSDSSNGISVIFIMNMISCIYAGIYHLTSDQKPSGSITLTIMQSIIELFPTTQLDKGVFGIGQIATDRLDCFSNNKELIFANQSAEDCSEYNYFTHKHYGIDGKIIALLEIVIFYAVIIAVYEIKLTQYIRNLIVNIVAKDTKNGQNQEENATSPADQPDEILKIEDATLKYLPKYYPLKDKITTSIKSINFDIKKGECFGLIGLNGAGKTSTFKITTGNQIPTTGKVTISGVTIGEDREKYCSSIGYCPQFDSLGDYLTGRQALYVFGHLRGVASEKIDSEVKNLLEMTGILALADIPIVCYSGGNKRKISLAVALIGFQTGSKRGLILLDEPTSGVDPHSRAVLHKIMYNAKQVGNSLMLSSHNLNECEHLCNRLGIVVEGKMKFVGKAEKVKQLFGFGYSLTIKLKSAIGEGNDAPSTSNDVDSSQKHSNSIKEYISRNHNWELRDHHGIILQYHADVSSYGYLFAKMEKMKGLFKNELDMYAISETTLEESFLAFINNQSNPENSEGALV